MEKINIAELLKDCPKGMELDCTIFNNVTFRGIDSGSSYPIGIKIGDKNTSIDYLTEFGEWNTNENSKCVIFPKGKTTWEGFVPPCKFKDGDIVITTLDHIAIIKEPSGKEYSTHVLKIGNVLIPGVRACASRFATEEEKQKLFDAIKKSGYKWNEETKKLEKVHQYPQTFEECCTVLGLTELGIIGGYRRGLLTQFRNLLICRDAYWKIAGEQMGLGKPWGPDWKNSEERRYCIVNIEGDINLPEKILTKWILKVTNKILVFPTEEMRDAFFGNFKELMNECNSLL